MIDRMEAIKGQGGAISRTVAVVGGGLSGGLFALKLSQARPDFRVVIIERGRRLGRGVAYGACAPHHLLNVPVSRMEVGLNPGFGDWLASAPHARAAMAPALAESGGDPLSAFAPRALFGDYLQERIAEAVITHDGAGLAAVRGEVVGLTGGVLQRLRLADGREIAADVVVLATGNMPPGAPRGPDRWLHDSPYFIPDPWAHDALDGLAPDAPLLLLGTGLTTVDIALKLAAMGHRGPLLALSRRGLTPTVHAGGGAWPAFIEDALPASPRRLTRLIRRQAELALAQGVPWQRVFDAARPAVPAVWRGWSEKQKRQFLRHLRTRWDVRRHRMAPRIAAALAGLMDHGQLRIEAGRVVGYRLMRDAAGEQVEVTYAGKDGRRTFQAARVINCTGPQRDLGRTGLPLLADLRDRGLALPDALGLGLETRDGALLDRQGVGSDRLFALGALTCPSWWEITAVPEIKVQVDRLVARLADEEAGSGPAPLDASDFLDLGAGI
jgi:uncharacterized NAD(P)/FAD-binding protein YdhS